MKGLGLYLEGDQEGDQEDLDTAMAMDMVMDMVMVMEMVLALTSLTIHSTQPSGLRPGRFLTSWPRFHQHLFT